MSPTVRSSPRTPPKAVIGTALDEESLKGRRRRRGDRRAGRGRPRLGRIPHQNGGRHDQTRARPRLRPRDSLRDSRMSKVNVAMTVNGKAVSAEVEPRTLLIHYLRENLSLPARTSAATPRIAAPAPSISTASRSNPARCSPSRRRAPRSSPSRGSPRRTARCMRCRRVSARCMASSAAFARRA